MKQSSFVLRKTADGSDTLFSEEMQESYHSINGAVQESRHVFIEAGFRQQKRSSIRIFEVGFGTGLNALLTWGEASRMQKQIDYHAIEAFPVSSNIYQSLNYQELEPALPSDAFLQLHQSVWGSPVIVETGRFCLTKHLGNFTEFFLEKRFDLIYFDAFAPDKQPEMWEEPLFERLFESLESGGILVTYCAKGEVRRQMQRCGFQVERLPGPPGKREMLRATKPIDQNKK
jgi:tRNA U34 5-methylaminomethyl-2-thiouridine-forming methyltransferase MnmC